MSGDECLQHAQDESRRPITKGSPDIQFLQQRPDARQVAASGRLLKQQRLRDAAKVVMLSQRAELFATRFIHTVGM